MSEEITFDAIIASGEAALAKLKERQDELRSELQSLDAQARRWVGLMKHAGYEFPAAAPARKEGRAAPGEGTSRLTAAKAEEWAARLRETYTPEDKLTAAMLAERFGRASTYMNKVVLALREHGALRLTGRNEGRGNALIYQLLPAPAQEGDD